MSCAHCDDAFLMAVEVTVHSPASRGGQNAGFDVTIPTPGSRFHFPTTAAASGQPPQSSPSTTHVPLNPAALAISPNGTIPSNSLLASPSNYDTARSGPITSNGITNGSTTTVVFSSNYSNTPPHTPSGSTLPAVMSSRAGPIISGPLMPPSTLGHIITNGQLPPPERIITPPGVLSSSY
jgi:hypothetical protein